MNSDLRDRIQQTIERCRAWHDGAIPGTRPSPQSAIAPLRRKRRERPLPRHLPPAQINGNLMYEHGIQTTEE
jgi:hypothetical protein